MLVSSVKVTCSKCCLLLTHFCVPYLVHTCFSCLYLHTFSEVVLLLRLKVSSYVRSVILKSGNDIDVFEKECRHIMIDTDILFFKDMWAYLWWFQLKVCDAALCGVSFALMSIFHDLRVNL